MVVKGYGFVKYGEVTCLLYICYSSENQPAWVVVESTTDIVVPSLGKRLVLMVATSIRELCRGNVDNSLPCSFRYLVYESHKVLVGVTESHSTTNAALEE